jgi:hypothetical protein
MNKNFLAIIVGFIGTLFTNTLLAMFVLQSFSAELLISRTKEQGLNFPALLSGYFLAAVFMVWLIKIVNKSDNGQTDWSKIGVKTGFYTALSFNIAGYMVVAGWSIASAPHMLMAAVIDSIATIFGAVVISYVLIRK